MKIRVFFITLSCFLWMLSLKAQQSTDTIPAKYEISTYQEETARAHRNAGNQFFKDGLYHEAIAEYTRAIASNPYDRISWYNRALSKEKLEDIPGAIHDLTRILKLDNGFVSAYFLRGSYYYKLEKYRDAKADFTAILSIRPNSALTFRKRGTVRYQMKDQNGALKDYNESIRLNPEDPIAYHDRAITREYLGDRKGAKEDQKKAKELQAASGE